MITVKLISKTQPAQDLKNAGIETAEQVIGYAARVSNKKNQANTGTMGRLLAYMRRKKHWSPFDMADMTVEIEVPRDISRQVLRHRSFAFQEFSQRYSDAIRFIRRDCRKQDPDNRQNSIELCGNAYDEDLRHFWSEAQETVIKLCQAKYHEAVERGIAKEVARCLLPEGLTVSTLEMKGSARSWMHYLDVRQSLETQKEHRELAGKIGDIFYDEFPALKPTRRQQIKRAIINWIDSF